MAKWKKMPPPTPPEPKQPKVKTKSEKLWQECMALGKKVDMMVANGRSSVKQTEDGANAWWWARNEVQPLQDSINVVQPVLDNWSALLHTSSFATFCKSKRR